jgi:hypothetical protein
MERPDEMRSDPFWEFGSFGLTGCHQRNLMHPGKAEELNGARLAFVQGGRDGFKLVYLTSPVRAVAYGDRTETRWEPRQMPFRYDAAPVVIAPDGKSDIDGVVELVSSVHRNGWMGKFASKFRSRRQPLPDAIAAAFIRCYDASRKRSLVKPHSVAQSYEQALPVNPPCVDRNRRRTYRRLLAQAPSTICR